MGKTTKEIVRIAWEQDRVVVIGHASKGYIADYDTHGYWATVGMETIRCHYNDGIRFVDKPAEEQPEDVAEEAERRRPPPIETINGVFITDAENTRRKDELAKLKAENTELQERLTVLEAGQRLSDYHVCSG